MDFLSILHLRVRNSFQTSSPTRPVQLTHHNLRLHDASRLSRDHHNANNMPQEQEYPLLTAATYQRPTTPQQNNNNNSNVQNPSALITPPETLRHSASQESLKAASVSMTVTSDVSLTADDIRSMSQELFEARLNQELPRTTSSPLNAQAVVEDYGFLIRLREQRGDPNTPPSDSYRQLLVEVARRIKERDSTLDEHEVKREAARRVSNYLSTLEHEQFIYNAATSTPSTVSEHDPSPSQTSQVDAETFSEEVLSIIEQVADQTLLDATEPLRHHEKAMKILDKCLREDSFMLKDRIKSLVGHDNAYAALIKKHEDKYAALLKKIEVEHQKQNMAFQLHDEALRNISESLSDTLSEHGSFYNTQNVALQGHTETFNQRLLVTHQQQEITNELLNYQRDIIQSLRAVTEPQGQVANFTSQNLATVLSIINQLSAITSSMPNSVNQAVAQSVQEHTQFAMQRVMHAQQQAMLAIREQEIRQDTIDYEALAATIVVRVQNYQAEHNAKESKRARISKAFKSLFCA